MIRRAAFRLIMVVATVAALELLARAAFPFLPGFERTRRVLRGEFGAAHRHQRCIGQAYLLYTRAPY